MPDARGRYYAITLADMWSGVVRGAEAAAAVQDGLRVYAMVAPDWHGKLPKPAEILRAPTSAGLLRLRIAYRGVRGPGGRARVPDPWKPRPCRAGARKPFRRTGSSTWRCPARAPVDQVAEMQPQAFFSAFAELAARYPPHAGDGPMLQRMERLGLAPGQRASTWSRLPVDVQAAVEAGAAARAGPA